MKKSRWFVLPGLVVVAAFSAWWWTQYTGPEVVLYRTASIERGNLQATVSASGAVNPVTQVSVGAQVSGQIRDLLVDFNSKVKAGELLARIDPETFEDRVRSAQADVQAGQAAVLTARASAAAGRAKVARAQVDLDDARRDFERNQSRVQMPLIAQSDADRARDLVNTSAEALRATQAQMGEIEAQIKTAIANVAQRQAALAQARVDLSRTRITSPVDGIVIKRAIEKGQTVAADMRSPELFVIAQNLSDMQVEVSVDEGDIGRIHAGERATFTVDAFPGQTFEGDVRQVREAARNISNVVTYAVVVEFPNTSGHLLPGMTANARIVTDQRDNVLMVPNAALRVRLAGVEPAVADAPDPANGASDVGSADASGWSWMSAAHAQQGVNGFAVQRERLVGALKLDSGQQAKLDIIMADMRPRLVSLADLDEQSRQSARQKLLTELRLKINAMLTPDQRAIYELMQARAEADRTAQAAGKPSLASQGTGAATALVAPGGDAPSVNAANTKPAAPVARANSAAPLTNVGPAAPAPGVAGGGAGGEPLQAFRGRIYLLGPDGKPQAFNVRLGISDGSSTELLVAADSPEAVQLHAGATVIVGIESQAGGPRLPF